MLSSPLPSLSALLSFRHNTQRHFIAKWDRHIMTFQAKSIAREIDTECCVAQNLEYTPVTAKWVSAWLSLQIMFYSTYCHQSQSP